MDDFIEYHQKIIKDSLDKSALEIEEKIKNIIYDAAPKERPSRDIFVLNVMRFVLASLLYEVCPPIFYDEVLSGMVRKIKEDLNDEGHGKDG